jgi:Fe-S-cluster containining protein
MAILEELVAAGAVDAKKLDARRQALMKDEYARVQKEQVHVQVSEVKDKYAITELPEIDCEARWPICKARCCKLYFPLSFQDLDERVVQWEYGLPYVGRKREDKYCVHNQASACTVYQHRPAICRTYTCKDDKRIWLDFEKRIPAPEDEKLYEIRAKMKPTPAKP